MMYMQYIWLVIRWSWLIALSAVVAGIVAFEVSQQIVPTYAASTTLLINQAPAASLSPDFNSVRASESLARTYVELLDKRPVLEVVIANLKLNTTPEALVKRIKVTLIPSTQVITLGVEDTDPQRAADIANEIVAVFSEQNQELQTRRYAASKQILEQELSRIQASMNLTQAKLEALKAYTTTADLAEQDQLRSLQAQYGSNYATVLNSFEAVLLAEAQSTDNLKVVEPAQPAIIPIRPKTLTNTILAVLIAAMITFGLVLLVDYLDGSIKSSVELEELIGISTLAAIGRMKDPKLSGQLLTANKTQAQILEAYRLLRINIEFAAVEKPIHTLIVTSSNRLEGKSITATNLAIVLAQAGKRVILVDANLRRPTLHKLFNQTNTQGVTTALLQSREGRLNDYLTSTSVDNLQLLLSGPLPPNPAELLGSQQMVELIEELKAEADIVVFDSPPLLPVVDPMVLAHYCDAALLVVLAGVTHSDALRITRKQLAQSGTCILGAVLNRVSTSHTSYHRLHNYSTAWPRERRMQLWPGLMRLLHLSSNGDLASQTETIKQEDSAEAIIGQRPYPASNSDYASSSEVNGLPGITRDTSDERPRSGGLRAPRRPKRKSSHGRNEVVGVPVVAKDTSNQ
jgi:capsular exopolysaccharide synthesis family protein